HAGVRGKRQITKNFHGQAFHLTGACIDGGSLYGEYLDVDCASGEEDVPCASAGMPGEVDLARRWNVLARTCGSGERSGIDGSRAGTEGETVAFGKEHRQVSP